MFSLFPTIWCIFLCFSVKRCAFSWKRVIWTNFFLFCSVKISVFNKHGRWSARQSRSANRESWNWQSREESHGVVEPSDQRLWWSQREAQPPVVRHHQPIVRFEAWGGWYNVSDALHYGRIRVEHCNNRVCSVDTSFDLRHSPHKRHSSDTTREESQTSPSARTWILETLMLVHRIRAADQEWASARWVVKCKVVIRALVHHH